MTDEVNVNKFNVKDEQKIHFVTLIIEVKINFISIVSFHK